ncbi:MAG TPA: hypothetical protein VG870_04205 [Chitinophagaceae bacterium]|nr:hypothetical protein [Chitinophagaceae bacterium]
MKDNSLFTKIFGWFITLLVLTIGGFYYAGAFFIPQVCDIDRQYLWCHFHPAGFLNYAGAVLFGIFVLFVSGIWGYVGLGFTTKKTGQISLIGLIIGVVSLILSFA